MPFNFKDEEVISLSTAFVLNNARRKSSQALGRDARLWIVCPRELVLSDPSTGESADLCGVLAAGLDIDMSENVARTTNNLFSPYLNGHYDKSRPF